MPCAALQPTSKPGRPRSRCDSLYNMGIIAVNFKGLFGAGRGGQAVGARRQ